jgi:hypothetical protein
LVQYSFDSLHDIHKLLPFWYGLVSTSFNQYSLKIQIRINTVGMYAALEFFGSGY